MSDKKKAAPAGMPSGIGAHGFEQLKAHRPVGRQEGMSSAASERVIDSVRRTSGDQR